MPKRQVTGEHWNPILVTILPKERRARHPYQLCSMALVFTVGLYQLLVGAPPPAAVNILDPDAAELLNWCCVVAGFGGIASAWIPERIIRVSLGWQITFDATYIRLFLELAVHFVLLAVWVSYAVVIWDAAGAVKGYGLGIGAGLWFGIAAAWRITQICWTLYKAETFTRRPTALLGVEDLERRGS